ncbi:SDR family NAD(P)-dependent oxidoreductase [bacterium]|nr:SDR family NAD(P)-dependent oxidoreductase [bacterium]
MTYNLKRYGQWAMVTGASAGIGLEFARALAAEGLNLILVARRRDRLQSLAAELGERNGVQTLVLEQDLAAHGAVESLWAALGDTRIDLAVLNAGVGYYGSLVDQEEQALERMVTLNCTNTVLLARRLLPGMLARGRGALILVSSVLGYFPGPWISAYSATKAFDLMLGESLAPELKGTGVDVLNLCPASTETEFHRVAAGGDPEREIRAPHRDDPADVVRWALKGLGRRMTVSAPTGRLAGAVIRFLPRAWVSALAGKVMSKGREKH